jgi:hypothetical protein
MNIRAGSLSYFLKDDLFFSLIIVLKVGWRFQHMKVQGHEPT